MHILLLAKVDNGTQEIEKSLKALEWLKKFYQGRSRKLFMVFCGYLNTDLEILSNIVL